MDTTKALNVFLSVARVSSFTQAALDTGLTPPAVSRAVAQLEQHLKIRLFHRTTRRVSLTDEGERLFELADAGLRLLDEAMDRTRYAKDQVSGSIRIAAPKSIGTKLLVPMIAAFQAIHPDVHFDAILDDHFTDMVAQKIDLGFRAGTEPDQNLIARPLGSMEQLICASPEYLKRHGRPASLEDLDSHRCTGFRHPNTGRPVPWEFQLGGEIVFHQVSAVALFNDVDAEVCAVRAGIGIGQLPTYMIRDELANGALINVMPNHATSRLGVYLYYARRERIPARVRQFIDFVVEEYPMPFGEQIRTAA